MNRTHFTKRRPKSPGTSPGVLNIDPDAEPTVIEATVFNEGSLEEATEVQPADLERLRDQPGVTWIDVVGLGTEKAIQAVGDAFDLHPLAMEDVVNVHQRPKLEEYGDVLFLVARMPRSADSSTSEQVSFFIGRGFLVSFQQWQGDCFDPVRRRIRQGRPRIRSGDADYLGYALLDAIVDAFFPVLETHGDRLLALEDRLLLEEEVPISELYDLKRDLLAIREAVRPLREATSQLARAESPVIAEHTTMFLRDCYDHVVQALDLVEAYRELASSLIELHRSNMSNRTNEVMRVLTIIATIFIPMTFVAGIYGMNFDASHRFNMPELAWPFGYLFAWSLMVGIGGAMLVFFRRKNWL